MKLSKVLAITLFGTIALTSTAMASGTKAGTKITNTPTLSYSMGGTSKTLKAPASSYVVDKVINFTITRSEATEHKVVAGSTKMVEFRLTNIGNSVENFKLSKWHNVNNIKFLSKKFYIDANGNGKLDKAERTDSTLVKKLAIDGSKKIWMELKIDSKAVVGKHSNSGVLAQAVDASSKPYSASKVNRMAVEDIVFADGKVYAPIDKARDGKMSMWYGFTITKGSKIELEKHLEFNHITADPKNGISKSRQEAESDKFQPVVNATRVKIFEVKNATKAKGKNIKVSIALNLTDEKVSKTSKYTWWGKQEKRVHIVWDKKSKKVVGVGKYNPKTKAIDFLIKEINAGEKLYLHVVTVLIKNAKVEKLEMKLAWNIISADPVNGVCRDANDAKSGKYKAIPGATTVRSWDIINNTKSVAHNVKFSIKIDSKVERVATTSKKTWWRSDKKVHVIYVIGKGNIGEGKYNRKTNSVDFFFKSIKAGEKLHPHIVTEIK
jgi:hypothetical protein